MNTRKFIFIPVWLLTLCVQPFLPSAHAWRSQKLTLQSWHDRGTDMALEFGFVFWVMFVEVLWLGWMLR